MQAIIDLPNPATVDLANLREAARQRKDIARMLRRLGRLGLRQFDGTN